MREVMEKLGILSFLAYITGHSSLALCNMVKDPWGVTNVNFIITTQPFHSYTIISLSVMFVLLYFYFLRDQKPLNRFFASIVLPLFPLIHYEFWFHFGMWVTYKAYMPRFWGLYTLLIGLAIYHLHMRWNILDFDFINKTYFICLYAIFLVLWWMLIDTGFYVKFVQHYHGEISQNPIGLLVAFGKSFSFFIWLPLVRKVKK